MMEEREIIKKLSKLHKARSTDPAVLCGATLHDFDLKHPDVSQYPKLQGELFQICHQRGDGWTNI